MHEAYVNHNIVETGDTTILLENIYAQCNWVHTDFTNRESTVRSTYKAEKHEVGLIHSLKIPSLYHSCCEKRTETLREKGMHKVCQTEYGVHMDKQG